MNEFNLIGTVVSYGTSKGNDWVDIEPLSLVSEPSITVYLDKSLDLSSYEKDFKNNVVVSISGWLKSNLTDDTLIAIANEIVVIRC